MKFALVIGACAMPCLGGELIHAVEAKKDTVKLEYTFSTDEPISYVMTYGQIMTADIMGEVFHSSESSSLVFDRELIEIQDDGTLVIAQRSKSYSYTEKSPEDVFEFDSTNPEHASLKLNSLVVAEVESIGWNIEILMSPQGDVVGIHNADEISNLIGKVSVSRAQDELTDMFSIVSITAYYVLSGMYSQSRLLVLEMIGNEFIP